MLLFQHVMEKWNWTAHRWLQAELLLSLFLPVLSELQSKAAWSRPKRSLIFSQPYNSPYLSITWHHIQHYQINIKHWSAVMFMFSWDWQWKNWFNQMTRSLSLSSQWCWCLRKLWPLHRIINHVTNTYLYCIFTHLKIQQVIYPPSKV